MIDELESGGKPYPIFFAGKDCANGQFPIDNTFFDETRYGNIIPGSTICPSFNKALCPVPMIGSMTFPPNLKITFFANDTHSGISTRVQEIGRTNFYSSDPSYTLTAHIPDLFTGGGILTWYSSQCNGEKNGCTVASTPANCNTPTIQPFDSDVSTPGRLLKSMISCNSTLWPSFIAINAAPFINGAPGAIWDACRALPNKPDNSTQTNSFQDLCVQNSSATIENSAYQTQWSVRDNDQNCGTQNLNFPQACSIIANQGEASSSGTNKSYNVDTGVGDCGPNYCGNCSLGTGGGGLLANLPCVGTEGLTYVLGSTKEIQVDFVNDANQVMTWEELQVLWCSKGVSIAGIPITRYTNGSPSCDAIMINSCTNTANLTINPDFDLQCTCVLENITLQARFSDLNLPSQCFSSICNIANNTDVYKLHSQMSGCNARLCSQILSIHGSSLFLGSDQSIICNGTVYHVTDVPTVSSVPLVSVVQPAYASYNVVTPVFFISLGILLMLFVVSLLWGIRAIRSKSREKKLAQDKFESELNKRSL
jgi:hypothetical protein